MEDLTKYDYIGFDIDFTLITYKEIDFYNVKKLKSINR